MTITFPVDDGYAPFAVPPAIINVNQLAALRSLLAVESEQRQTALTIAEYGRPGASAFAFEARVCPLSLASVSQCFDHYPAAITVLDEAQFRGRRVRVWKAEQSDDIWLGLSSNPDAAPEFEVSTSKGYAILELLGLEAESTGTIPVSELRARLSDPVIHKRLDAEPGLRHYMPNLSDIARLKPIEGELHLAWA